MRTGQCAKRAQVSTTTPMWHALMRSSSPGGSAAAARGAGGRVHVHEGATRTACMRRHAPARLQRACLPSWCCCLRCKWQQAGRPAASTGSAGRLLRAAPARHAALTYRHGLAPFAHHTADGQVGAARRRLHLWLHASGLSPPLARRVATNHVHALGLCAAAVPPARRAAHGVQDAGGGGGAGALNQRLARSCSLCTPSTRPNSARGGFARVRGPRAPREGGTSSTPRARAWPSPSLYTRPLSPLTLHHRLRLRWASLGCALALAGVRGSYGLAAPAFLSQQPAPCMPSGSCSTAQHCACHSRAATAAAAAVGWSFAAADDDPDMPTNPSCALASVSPVARPRASMGLWVGAAASVAARACTMVSPRGWVPLGQQALRSSGRPQAYFLHADCSGRPRRCPPACRLQPPTRPHPMPLSQPPWQQQRW